MQEEIQDLNFDETIAWRTGWQAAANNKTACQNPWSIPDYRKQWLEGWNAWHEAHTKTSDAATEPGRTPVR